jgi:hypothetical protein
MRPYLIISRQLSAQLSTPLIAKNNISDNGYNVLSSSRGSSTVLNIIAAQSHTLMCGLAAFFNIIFDLRYIFSAYLMVRRHTKQHNNLSYTNAYPIIFL